MRTHINEAVGYDGKFSFIELFRFDFIELLSAVWTNGKLIIFRFN